MIIQTRQDNTIQASTIQYDKRQDKTRHAKIVHGNITQYVSRQDNTIQANTRTFKTI